MVATRCRAARERHDAELGNYFANGICRPEPRGARNERCGLWGMPDDRGLARCLSLNTNGRRVRRRPIARRAMSNRRFLDTHSRCARGVKRPVALPLRGGATPAAAGGRPLCRDNGAPVERHAGRHRGLGRCGVAFGGDGHIVGGEAGQDSDRLSVLGPHADRLRQLHDRSVSTLPLPRERDRDTITDRCLWKIIHFQLRSRRLDTHRQLGHDVRDFGPRGGAEAVNEEQPPLFAGCGKCGGSGDWTEPPVAQGSGWSISGRGDCPDCDGLGLILSRQGSEVLELIRRLRSKGRL